MKSALRQLIAPSRTGVPTALMALVPALNCQAQDLEPRRWSHLPSNMNFGGIAYAYTEADVSLDPVMRLEDVSAEVNTIAFKYIRSFEVFDKAARFDLLQAYQDGSWAGLLNGTAAATSRSGMTDTALRLAVNLYGAPPLTGQEFKDYRAAQGDHETIIGAALVAVLPTGEYYDDRLINLGGNRFVLRPQLGAVHSFGKWTAEVTSSVSFFTDNDELLNDNHLEQDPLFSLDTHLIYSFKPGLWAGLSAGYDFGGRSTINGDDKDDRRNQFSWGATVGFSVSPQLGFKLAFLNSQSMERVGTDNNTAVFAMTFVW